MTHADPVGQLPLWSALPFAGILLSIALFPLLAPHFWHRHYPKVSAAWALIFAVPFLFFLRDAALQSILHIVLVDYVPFLILLWSLFTISGGIVLEGDLRGSPGANVLVLAVGTVLASWIGTTGAAMLLIRPLLRANAWRRTRVHIVCFFIFLVANVGGSLTPLGDPPLFLGFLHGVPFFWVTRALLLPMAFVAGLVLVAFYVVDRRAYRAETARPARVPGARGGLRLRGALNFLWLLGVMAGVVFSGSTFAKNLPVAHVYGHVEVPVGNWLKDAALILMGILSLVTTRKELRTLNEFSWGPIREVAYLFAGIFVTIIPALAILKAGPDGALAGFINAVRTPWQFFWASGALSSFLDNAPTYLTFFNAALGQLGAPESQVPAMLGHAGAALRDDGFVRTLTAISAGSVFMGANTYIGNAPNFMVKSIAEEAGVTMPSFFGYMFKYSLVFLVPAFALATLVFFRSF
jgi:Na+/H+ antiporter NhaD/arsenite permease-like protein